MRAKFIKHKNPRKSLGLDMLSKRDFDSYEEFVDWVYKYLIPNFYGMPNGPELYKKIIKTVRKEGSIIPQDVFNYIFYKIKPNIKIKGQTMSHWSSRDIRSKYPFPRYNKDL